MAFWEWGRYVPVAERRAKARREMDKLRKKGQDIQPVNIDGRTIARSFGAPVIEPPGKVARRTSARPAPGRSRPSTTETR